MISGSGPPSPSSFWGFYTLRQSITLMGILRTQLPASSARTAPLMIAPALSPDQLSPWLPRMRGTPMVALARTMATASLYGPRVRISVLTPVHCLADRFCPLTKSPSISGSVFTLFDPRLTVSRFTYKLALVSFWMRVRRRSTHFAGLEWVGVDPEANRSHGNLSREGLMAKRNARTVRRPRSLGSLRNRVKKSAVFFLAMGLMLHPSIARAQAKAFPHLQIFLVSAEPASKIPLITFWDASHKLAAGPFPIKLLEREGLSVLLDLSYSKPNEERPSAARLKIQRRDSASLQGQAGLVLLDQPADFIADRGVSKMFPGGPFLVIGHKARSEGVLQVGTMMGEIQRRLLVCDRESRQQLETVLNSLKGMASYDHVSGTIESTFPPCPLQRP